MMVQKKKDKKQANKQTKNNKNNNHNNKNYTYQEIFIPFGGRTIGGTGFTGRRRSTEQTKIFIKPLSH